MADNSRHSTTTPFHRRAGGMKFMSELTILPDGSAFSTATVMSKDEAMLLPVNKRPLCFRISSEIYHAVFEHIGEASMCWNPRPSDEVFNSEMASDVAVRLCFKIADEVEKSAAELERLKAALTKIARYDEESIWDDDRDDAANAMLDVAREALGEKP